VGYKISDRTAYLHRIVNYRWITNRKESPQQRPQLYLQKRGQEKFSFSLGILCQLSHIYIGIDLIYLLGFESCA
jgi:hypothetical protein